MRLMINAANLRHGGGLALTLPLLKAVFDQHPDDSFLLACPAGLGYEQLAATHVEVRTVPDRYHHRLAYKYFFNRIVLPRWARRFGADKIASLGNVAIAARGIPQLVYIQIAHLLYPESEAWKRMSFRTYISNRLMVAYITSQLSHARGVALQTEAMKERFEKKFHEQGQLTFLLPNAAPVGVPGHALPDGLTKLRLLLPAAYYAHKNLESLIPLAQEIQRQALPVTITLTLPDSQPMASRLLQDIDEQNLNHILPNAGYQSAEGLERLWAGHDGLFLPTLLESYSGAYVDAATRGKAIFTSNLDFATRLLGDAAWYFDPLSTDSIVTALQQALAQPSLLAQKAQSGLLWAAQQPDMQTVAQRLRGMLEAL